MLTEDILRVGGLTLNVARSAGNGPPLVLLHGVTRRWQDCLCLLPNLSLRWQLHVPDFRGHGQSGRAPGAYLVRDYVADTRALLEEHVRHPAVLLGHSLGALVAAALAAEMPDRVKAVILEDPPALHYVRNIKDTPNHGLFLAMRTIAARKLAVPEAARQLGQVRFGPHRGGILLPLSHFRDATSLRFTARSLQQMDPEVLTPVIEGRWLEGLDLEESLHRVRCPALLLSGDVEYGGHLPIHDAEHTSALLHDCIHIHMPKVGHLIHLTQPDTTLRLVNAFLESL